MDEFTKHSMVLQENDQVYLFSDGYADQFGGPEGKKFKYKAFKELVLNNFGKSMKEQEKTMIKVFDQWKGTNEQIDDVVVVGFRV